MQQGAFVETRLDGDVALLAMDDGRANVMSIPTLQALAAAYKALAEDVRAVVLHGRPRFFSAGIDLQAYKEYDAAQRAEHTRALAGALLEVFTFRRPVVAGVTGHAIAGGALLALACDVRVMALGEYKLATNEVALGVDVPDFGIAIAEAALPRHLLTRLLLHGVTLSSAQAHEQGVVAELASPESVVARAVARAHELAATVGHEAYALTKARVRGPAADKALASLEKDIAGFSGRVAQLAAGPRK